MSVGYGSVFTPPRVLKKEIGRDTLIKRKSGWIGILRILATIAEIGIAFTPIGALAETATGLAFGGFNQFLDKESNTTSAVGTFLNFGAPLIGGSFVARSNARGLSKALTGVESYAAAEAAELGGKITGTVDTVLGYTKSAQGTFAAYNKGVWAIDKELKSIGNYFTASELARIGNAGLKVSDNLIRETFEDENFFKSLGFTDKEIDAIKAILERSKSQVNATRGLEDLGRLLSEMKRTASPEARKFIKDFEKGMKFLIKKTKKLDLPEASIIYRSLVDAAERHGVRYGESINHQVEGSLLRRAIKKIGTAKFNDRIVQKAQLIDPNDMGRAPIEFLYQKLRKKIGKYFKNVEKIDDAFERTGGINLDSRWVRGYKVVIDSPVKKLIMIAFRPETTNKKRPVLVWATPYQIKQLITKSPGQTYQKYWALSKGGKAIGISTLFGGLTFSHGVRGASVSVNAVLSFIPVQALKNILSIVSNYVENFHDMADGSYQKNWFKKFSGSMERSAISRTFRLGGKVIAGGYAARRFGREIGRFIGAELQRVGTQIAAVSIKNAIAGKPAGAGLVRNLKRGALVSVRSNLLRKARRKRGGSSAIITTLSARRKLQQVKRIPNAVVAGRPFKGIKI